ncbi:putative LRR receptor-like serine/threonine-protein kinase [Hibiscus syriacus]|uniref:LRR receptor-like serine/threonine-protein kinase n=1 Tax=Hibiscus syriacus TaxID=106335 RepID=A0A6A2YAX3_HIBSY|nr:putative LRR receptor-like serine/threonine-protein kinase [Hibiscus syriacus]
MKVILRKDGCLAAISERLVDFTDDNKLIEMDGNAMANFYLALAYEVLSSIEEKKTVKEIWDHLTKLYEATSLHNKIFLKRKLYTLCMSEPTSVTEHLNTLNTLFSHLTSLRCTIGQLLNFYFSLPDSYDQLIINLTNNKQVNLQQAEALTTMRGRSTERGQSSSHKHGRSKSRSKKNLKCYNCGKKGHLKKDCWSLNKNSNPQGNTANTSDDGDALCCEASTTVEGRKRYADIWLIDSGATYHMTSRREWFHHYEPVSGGSVYSCNDHTLEIVGVGTIKLKMYDGTIKIVRDVQDRCWVYPIKKKSDVFSTFKNFKARVELDSGNKIKCFRTDNGGEYTSEEFDDFCRKECIKRQFTVANTPQQNGVAERMNITFLERTRAMLRDASLEKSFWVETFNTACRAPSTAIKLKTPMEMWNGKPADYSNLHVFGSIVYDPTACKVIISRDVIFVEDKLQRKEDDDSAEKSDTTKIHVDKEVEQGDSSKAEPTHDEQEPESSEAPTTHQSDRVRRHPNWHSDYVIEVNIAYCLLTDDGPNKDHIEELKAQLAREFEIKDLGSANKILGMQIHRDRNCKPISIPVPINFKLSSSMSPSSEEERMEMSRVSYASAVGSLMFAIICTRPNIAQAVGVVSLYMENPGKEHWNTVNRILRYIKGTSNVALYYEGSNLLINGYVDSDYAGDLDKSKSTTGYAFKVAGGVVSWVSKLQSVVATSTTEAEYVAVTQASKEAIWLKMLLEELGHNQESMSLCFVIVKKSVSVWGQQGIEWPLKTIECIGVAISGGLVPFLFQGDDALHT